DRTFAGRAERVETDPHFAPHSGHNVDRVSAPPPSCTFPPQSRRPRAATPADTPHPPSLTPSAETTAPAGARQRRTRGRRRRRAAASLGPGKPPVRRI